MWPNACVVRYEGGKMEKCMKLDKVADVTTSEIALCEDHIRKCHWKDSLYQFDSPDETG